MLEVKYFARLREVLRADSEWLDPSETGATVAELRRFLVARGEPWSALAADNVLVAVNKEIVTESTAIKAGDEVGFFPPVSGG